MTTKLTTETITDDQIVRLLNEALSHDDHEQADICRVALGGEAEGQWSVAQMMTVETARQRCVGAINSARSLRG